MGVSKVVYGDDTLVDLTGDTVTPTSLTLGATAHGADGEPIVGEYQYVLPPMSSDTRGGARIQPDSGLEITDTDNLQVRLALESDGTVRGGIAELTAKGHAEQDGTPSPDNPVPIQVVRGRNLLDITKNTPRKSLNSSGELTNQGAWWQVSDYIEVKAGASYTTSGMVSVSDNACYCWYTSVKEFISSVTYNAARNTTITAPSNARYLRISYDTDDTQYQLTIGSTPQPYVPYGHVGMEVRDPDTDELISCTALPLPQRGWVAGLPDGTADSLRLDGAGKCEWTLPLIMRDTFVIGSIALQQDGTVSFPLSNISAKYNTYVLCNVAIQDGPNDSKVVVAGTDIYMRFAQSVVGSAQSDINDWLNTHCKLLHELATPITEDCGYVDMPAIASDATISIPELDALNVKYFIDDAVLEYGRQMYERAVAEIGGAVVDLAARVAALES